VALKKKTLKARLSDDYTGAAVTHYCCALQAVLHG